MGKRVRYRLWVIAFGLMIIVAAAAGWWLAADRPVSEPPAAAMPLDGEQTVENRQVHLFFSDKQGRFLNSEPRIIRKTNDEALFGRMLVQELIQGPRTGGGRTLPQGIAVRTFFITDSGLAVVDFNEGAYDDHPGGAAGELLSIYSVVNTLLLNSDTIRSVRFLIGGRQAATLVGHIDASRPFTANMLLVR